MGSLGTGKDHLAAAMLYEAAQRFGIASRWVRGRATFQASRDAMANDRSEEELLGPMMKAAILCISDPAPGAASLSSWNVDLLFRVIDDRYARRKPTWMTLNARDVTEAGQKLTPAVWERLRDQAEVIRCLWESRRREARVT